MAKLQARRIKYHHITRGHQGTCLFPIPGPNVDVELTQFGDCFGLFRRGQVVSFQANDAGNLLLAHQDGLSQEDPPVNSSHRTKL